MIHRTWGPNQCLWSGRDERRIPQAYRHCVTPHIKKITREGAKEIVKKMRGGKATHSSFTSLGEFTNDVSSEGEGVS